MPTTANKEPKEELVVGKIENLSTGVPEKGLENYEDGQRIPEMESENHEVRLKTVKTIKEKKEEVKKAVPIPLKKRDKVAVCGFSPTTKHLAPYTDQTFDIWGCNELWQGVPRLDVLFEVHDRSFPEFVQSFRNPKHIEWLQKATIPIMMVKHYDDIPMSIPYPINEMVQNFGGFFNNTISYMVALAISLKYKEIHLYGVDMSHPTEWDQRASVCMFLGIAQGMFAVQGWPKIVVPPESLILKAPFLYGFQSNSAIKVALEQTRDYYSQQMITYQGQVAQLDAARNQYLGAVEAFNGFIRQHIKQ